MYVLGKYRKAGSNLFVQENSKHHSMPIRYNIHSKICFLLQTVLPTRRFHKHLPDQASPCIYIITAHIVSAKRLWNWLPKPHSPLRLFITRHQWRQFQLQLPSPQPHLRRANGHVTPPIRHPHRPKSQQSLKWRPS